jgi:hypothetical protein
MDAVTVSDTKTNMPGLLQWFDHSQTTADLLVLLATNTGHAQAQIEGLLKDVCRINSIIGERIAFMFFRPIEGGRSSAGRTGGQTLEAMVRTKDEAEFKTFARYVAFNNFSVLDEVKTQAGLNANDIPCLVIYYRGLPSVSIVTLGGATSAEHIVDVLREVTRVYQQSLDDFPALKLQGEQLARLVFGGRKLVDQAAAAVRQIAECLRGLQRKHDLPSARIEALISSYNADRFPDDLIAVLRAMVDDPAHPVLKDQRLQKADRLTNSLRSHLSRLRDLAVIGSKSFDLETAENHRLAMEKVESKIQELQRRLQEGLGGRPGADRDLLRDANSWASLIKTGTDIFAFVNRVFRFVPIS